MKLKKRNIAHKISNFEFKFFFLMKHPVDRNCEIKIVK